MTMEATRNHFKMSEGDWICYDPHCANINFATRNKCYRCQKDRRAKSNRKKLGQEIGMALANKSKGLFSADDWQCHKCANVNWARRTHCNMCNAPKFVNIEERNGYGGGYNDRGVVEYIRHDDSDSEYDDFGRKKKMKKNKKELFNENLSKDNFEEIDEDDDSDLSKYDLSGWVDDKTSSNVRSNRDIDSRQANVELKRHCSSSLSTSRSRSPANCRK